MVVNTIVGRGSRGLPAKEGSSFQNENKNGTETKKTRNKSKWNNNNYITKYGGYAQKITAVGGALFVVVQHLRSFFLYIFWFWGGKYI